MLQNLKRGLTVNTNLRITDKPPSNTSPSYSPQYPPNLRMLSISSDDSLLPNLSPQSRPRPLQIQIPGPSVGPPTPSNYGTPLSARSPVAQSPGIPTPPSPNVPSILSPQPVPVASPPSPAALLIPLTLPQPTPVLPLTERATLAPQAARPPSELSQEPVSEGGAFSEAQQNPPRMPITEVSLSATMTITSREVRRIPGSHAEGIGGGIDEQLPSQVPNSYFEHAGAPNLAPKPASPPRPDEEEPGAISQGQPQRRKRNWFQKYIFDYKKTSGSHPR
jgi:hypothetical protein